jgi:uncharacterized membrane protein
MLEKSRALPFAPRADFAENLLASLTALVSRQSSRIGAAIFAAFIALTCIASAKFPHPNWDLLPYVAAGAEHRINDPQQLHDFAYEKVKEAVDLASFDLLAKGDAYRARQFEDAAAFNSMLPMYRVKTLYISLIAGLAPYFGEVGAIRLISLLSTLATGLCVGLWLFREKAMAYAPAAAGVMMIAGYPDIARLGSPDALFMALFTFGLYALYRKREMVSVLALFLAFMVRADTIAFLGILAVLFVLFRQVSLGAFGAFTAAVIAYSSLSHGAGHPGWWTHFWFSNVEQKLTMEGFHPEFSIAVYLKALASGIVRCVTELAWPGLLIILIAAWAFVRSSLGKMEVRSEIIFLALAGGIIARFILFPLPDARVHGAYLTPLFLLLLPSIKTLLSVWKPAPAA